MRQYTNKRYPSGVATVMPVLCILFLGLFTSVLFFGCAHTVDYSPRDTVTINHHDTVFHHDTLTGPAFLRFITVLNEGTTSPFILITMKNGDLFTTAGNIMTNEFLTVPHDSVFYLYASYFIDASTKKNDSIPIPRLKSYSMTTIVLFKTTDASDPNRLSPVFVDDSVRRNLAPNDSCYIRLINGVPDYPQPFPSVNLHVDDIHAPALFKDNASYQEIRNYVVMPAGNHQIYVRSETDITQSYFASQQFIAGKFYTVRLTGRHNDTPATDQLTIDSE